MSLDSVIMRMLDRSESLERSLTRLAMREGAAPYIAQAAAGLANPFIDPGFNIWNEGTSFLPAGNGQHGAEGWAWGASTDGSINMFQHADVPAVAAYSGVPMYSIRIDTATTDASIGAAQYAHFGQRIEGRRAAPFLQRAFSFGFWVKATKIGIYCVSFRNGAADRSYVSEFTVNVANTWEEKIIHVPASPSAGTWDYLNGTGLIVAWALASGSNYHTTPNTWVTGNFIATANQVNMLDNGANDIRLFGPRIVAGLAVPPFMSRPYDIELLITQRYYCKTFAIATAPVQNSGTISGALSYRVHNAGAVVDGVHWPFPVRMRAIPSVTFYNPSAANTNWRNISTGADSGAATVQSNGEYGIIADSAGAAGDGIGQLVAVHASASARLT